MSRSCPALVPLGAPVALAGTLGYARDMREALVMVIWTAACAAPVAEVAWKACPVVRTADGRDVDDGGVDVSIEVHGAAARQASIGHFPGACRAQAAEGSTLVCSDPHVDVRYELSWARSSPETLTVERREYTIPDVDGVPPPTTPAVRRTVATFDVGKVRLVQGKAHCP